MSMLIATYQVTLTVEDGNNCSDDYQTLAVVRCNPLADFYVDNEPICDGDSVEFINQSVLVTGSNSVNGTGTSVIWVLLNLNLI